MRLRSHRQNLVGAGLVQRTCRRVRCPEVGAARTDQADPYWRAVGSHRTDALAESVRTRRGAGLLVAGAVLTVAGIRLPSGVIQISGMLVLLRGMAVALGVSERHRLPGGEPAGRVDVAGFRAPP